MFGAAFDSKKKTVASAVSTGKPRPAEPTIHEKLESALRDYSENLYRVNDMNAMVPAEQMNLFGVTCRDAADGDAVVMDESLHEVLKKFHAETGATVVSDKRSVMTEPAVFIDGFCAANFSFADVSPFPSPFIMCHEKWMSVIAPADGYAAVWAITPVQITMISSSNKVAGVWLDVIGKGILTLRDELQTQLDDLTAEESNRFEVELSKGDIVFMRAGTPFRCKSVDDDENWAIKTVSLQATTDEAAVTRYKKDMSAFLERETHWPEAWRLYKAAFEEEFAETNLFEPVAPSDVPWLAAPGEGESDGGDDEMTAPPPPPPPTQESSRNQPEKEEEEDDGNSPAAGSATLEAKKSKKKKASEAGLGSGKDELLAYHDLLDNKIAELDARAFKHGCQKVANDHRDRIRGTEAPDRKSRNNYRNSLLTLAGTVDTALDDTAEKLPALIRLLDEASEIAQRIVTNLLDNATPHMELRFAKIRETLDKYQSSEFYVVGHEKKIRELLTKVQKLREELENRSSTKTPRTPLAPPDISADLIDPDDLPEDRTLIDAKDRLSFVFRHAGLTAYKQHVDAHPNIAPLVQQYSDALNVVKASKDARIDVTLAEACATKLKEIDSLIRQADAAPKAPAKSKARASAKERLQPREINLVDEDDEDDDDEEVVPITCSGEPCRQSEAPNEREFGTIYCWSCLAAHYVPKAVEKIGEAIVAIRKKIKRNYKGQGSEWEKVLEKLKPACHKLQDYRTYFTDAARTHEDVENKWEEAVMEIAKTEEFIATTGIRFKPFAQVIALKYDDQYSLYDEDDYDDDDDDDSQHHSRKRSASDEDDSSHLSNGRKHHRVYDDDGTNDIAHRVLRVLYHLPIPSLHRQLIADYNDPAIRAGLDGTLTRCEGTTAYYSVQLIPKSGDQKCAPMMYLQKEDADEQVSILSATGVFTVEVKEQQVTWQ